jgi:hypothetical protein
MGLIWSIRFLWQLMVGSNTARAIIYYGPDDYSTNWFHKGVHSGFEYWAGPNWATWCLSQTPENSFADGNAK